MPQRDPRRKGWEGLHQTERAVDDYQRAVTLNPESREGRLASEALDHAGRVREATAHFECLCQIEPSNPAVPLGLAHCRFESHELGRRGSASGYFANIPAGPRCRARGAWTSGLVSRTGSRGGREVVAGSRSGSVASRGALTSDRCLETLSDSDRQEQCRAQLRELEASDAEAGRLTLRYRDMPKDASAALRWRGGRCEMAAKPRAFAGSSPRCWSIQGTDQPMPRWPIISSAWVSQGGSPSIAGWRTLKKEDKETRRETVREGFPCPFAPFSIVDRLDAGSS